MPSRLVAELEAAAAAETDRVRWSICLSRIAIHLARQGDFDGAQRRIAQIRTHYGVELHPVVASWVMLAEGVLHFGQADMAAAYERIRRAYSLATALNNQAARPLCAAWLALLEFNAAKYTDMAEHLAVALRDAAPDDHQARGRACLLVADVLHFADSHEAARTWYEKARVHATAQGDQAMLSAVLYNVAAMRTAHLRLSDVFGEVSPQILLRATMEAMSSFTYDMAVSAVSFTELWRLQHGGLRNIRREFGDAKLLLDSIQEPSMRKRHLPVLLADLAWANKNLGFDEIAAEQAERALQTRGDLTEPDDIAFVLARLAQVANGFQRDELSSKLMAEALVYFEEHKQSQAALREIIRPVLPPQ